MFAEDDIGFDVYTDDFFGEESEEFPDVVFWHIIKLFDELHLKWPFRKTFRQHALFRCYH